MDILTTATAATAATAAEAVASTHFTTLHMLQTDSNKNGSILNSMYHKSIQSYVSELCSGESSSSPSSVEDDSDNKIKIGDE